MKERLHTDTIAGFLGLQWQRKGEQGVILLQGEDSDEATRVELIERSMRGEQIELLLHARTYAQGDDFTCSRPVEFTEDGLQIWTERAPDTPLQFDHSWGEHDCGGRCMTSSYKHLGGNNYEIVEGILLNTPRSVQSALRGNMRKFSLGIDSAPDTILCSLCSKPYFGCAHYAGETEDGVLVKLQYTDPIPIERSAVLYPAVLETGVLGYEQLSALFPDKHKSEKGEAMNPSAIAVALGLDANADESAILQAIAVQRSQSVQLGAKVEKLGAELAASKTQVTKLSERLTKLQADKATAELDGKIAQLKADARITDAQEAIIRDLFTTGHTESAMELAASFEQAPTTVPTGPRQSLPTDDATRKHTPTAHKLSGDIDWQSLIDQVPEHIRTIGGNALQSNPRAYLEANKHSAWVQRLGIDWDTASQERPTR